MIKILMSPILYLPPHFAHLLDIIIMEVIISMYLPLFKFLTPLGVTPQYRVWNSPKALPGYDP